MSTITLKKTILFLFALTIYKRALGAPIPTPPNASQVLYLGTPSEKIQAPPLNSSQKEDITQTRQAINDEAPASPIPITEIPPLVLPDPVPDDDEREFDRSEERYEAGFLECPCSPTARGFNPSSVMKQGRRIILFGNKSGATDLMALCVARHGTEACINWDAIQALNGGKRRLCMVDLQTARNVVQVGGGRVRTVGSCGASKETRSKPSSLAPTPEAKESPKPDTLKEDRLPKIVFFSKKIVFISVGVAAVIFALVLIGICAKKSCAISLENGSVFSSRHFENA